jgi:hypothetical protein
MAQVHRSSVAGSPAHEDADPRSALRPARSNQGEMDRHRLGVTLFLVAAAASFLLSIALWFTDNRQEGLFVGLWVPSILAAGAFWLTAVRRS